MSITAKPEETEPRAGRAPHSFDFARTRSLAARVARAEAGPLELLSERDHPLARAEAIRSGQRLKLLRCACLAVPLGAFAALLAATRIPAQYPAETRRQLAAVAGYFACYWPTVMFLAASLGAAGAVIAERVDGTAAQLVLTPISRRTLAGAKIVPHAVPCLLGIVACLPLYVWGGCNEFFFVGDRAIPTPLVVWPLRMLTPLGGGWDPSLWPRAIPLGALMCFADAAAVWTAAHWGSIYGLRLGGVTAAAVHAVARAGTTGLRMLGCYAPAALTYSVLMLTNVAFGKAGMLGAVPPALAIVGAAAVLVILLRFLVVCPAVRAALDEFAYFDRLAAVRFDPRYRLNIGDHWAIRDGEFVARP
jgi:hypothetical protein